MESSSGTQKNQMENVSTNTASGAEAGAEVASSPQNNDNTFPAVDRWLTQLPVVAPRSQFNGHNLYLWEMVVDQALSPRSLLPHLTQDAPLPTDPRFKRWIVEEQTVRSWLLDSMSTDYFQKFIEYKTAKGIWEAVHKFYSKKNDSSKISALVSRANSLQQGDKSVMEYANELSSIYNELNFYRPPQYSTLQWEYTVQDRIYHLLEGLRPEFEGLRSQLYNSGISNSFDDIVAAVVREEGRLQQMKVNPESSAFFSYHGGNIQKGQNSSRGQERGQQRQGKDGFICNFCKRTGHTRERCWKLHGRPPHVGQVHIAEGSNQQGSQVGHSSL